MRTKPDLTYWLTRTAFFVLMWPLIVIEWFEPWRRRANNDLFVEWWSERPDWLKGRWL